MTLPGNQIALPLTEAVSIPIVGLGTWDLRGPSAVKAVHSALDIGYRHIDTASMYHNESQIGRALRQSGLPRESVFVTSKVWNSDHGFDSTLRACAASLDRLDTPYLDLYLIHWPSGATNLRETWQALEKLNADGKTRAIGVSNYTVSLLRDMLDYASVLPALNQIELHPWNLRRQQPVIDFCQQHGIHVQAYTPLNKARRLDRPPLQAIAEQYGKHPTQVILRWDIQHQFITIPKSARPDHQRSNLDVFDFVLSADEMAQIDALGQGVS